MTALLNCSSLIGRTASLSNIHPGRGECGRSRATAVNTDQAEGQEIFHDSKILIVDDEPDNVRMLQCVLKRSGYLHIETTSDSRQAAALFEKIQPDIVLLDLHMPTCSGFDVMKQIQPMIPEDTYLPILILTADGMPATRNRALSMGAKDFLTKPINATEARLRVHNLLETRAINQNLKERIRERTQALEEAQTQALLRLAEAADLHDDDRGAHTRRVGELAALLAQRLGLDEEQVDRIRRAAPLHDVGKIGIPDSILLKLGSLTPDEFEVIKSHTLIGGSLLRGGQCDLASAAETIARTHHERWDGRGYPCGLQGEDIPLEGRITAVADAFDAMTHERPYKSAWPLEEALSVIESQSGLQFDPFVVRAFSNLVQEQPTTVVSL